MIVEARKHISVAKDQIQQAGETKELLKKWIEANVSVSAMEKWANSCKEGELAVRLGIEALCAGNIDEAGSQCNLARKLLERGLKCESLQGLVEDLQQALASGKLKYVM